MHGSLLLAALSLAITPTRSHPPRGRGERVTYTGRANQVKVRPPRLDRRTAVVGRVVIGAGHACAQGAEHEEEAGGA